MQNRGGVHGFCGVVRPENGARVSVARLGEGVGTCIGINIFEQRCGPLKGEWCLVPVGLCDGF